MAAASAGVAAEPTAAYCERRSSWAFTDQGISSQSRHAQSVSSFRHRSAASKAARTRASSPVSSAASLKNRRPVRVKQMPVPPSATPKRLRATSSSRHTTTTAREPMCFSSHTTLGTPCPRK